MRIVGGKWRGRTLTAPKTQRTRPTTDRTREALFSILSSSNEVTLDGAYVLDLFAGTGALGFEALSRGADYCLFVENDAQARGAIRTNSDTLMAAGCSKIYRRDATQLGPRPSFAHQPFNLVFADPPYGQGLGEKALLSALQGGWLDASSLIIVEEDKRSAFAAPDGFHQLDRRPYGDTEIIFLKLA